MSQNRNAADVEQVTHDKRRAKDRDREATKDLQTMLTLPEARRTLWRWLSAWGLYSSTFSTDAGLMAYRAGKQDAGHEVLAEIIAAHPAAYDLMQAEARARAGYDDREREARRTPRAEETKPEETR